MSGLPFAICGLRYIQMDEEGEWESGIWTDSCTERRIKRQFQAVGTRPGLLERRNGLSRGFYKRLATVGRFPIGRILTAAQYCLSSARPAIRRPSRSSAPIRPTPVGGRMTTRASRLLRKHRSQGNSFHNGHCPWWCRTMPWRRCHAASCGAFWRATARSIARRPKWGIQCCSTNPLSREVRRGRVARRGSQKLMRPASRRNLSVRLP